MSAEYQNPVTRFVKRFLDVVRALVFVSLFLWPLFVVVMTISQHSGPATWGVDIDVFARFVIDLNAFVLEIGESVGVRDPIISGKSALNIDTSSLNALYVFTAMTEVGGVLGLYIVVQLRSLFAALQDGASFSTQNSRRIKNVGIAVICWTMISPFLQYFGGLAILAEYSLQVPGVQLYPAFKLNSMGLFVGLAMIVLSGVLNEAVGMQKTQELTI